MTCRICNSANTTSLGMRTPHTYCNTCGGHDYECQLFDRKTWDAWVNGDIERPVREEQLDMFGEVAA
tara:strand:- start:70 stop:270 length:201 start_codon:yes stop_codon:yes gene_type:complete